MDADLARKFYPGSVFSSDVDNDVETGAKFGKQPIREMVIFGHAGIVGRKRCMFGASGASYTFAPVGLNPEEPAPDFNRAVAGLLPRRCWFTRNAFVRAVGCDSKDFGDAFAAVYLRKGAEIQTTTAAVRPKCTPAHALSTGGCSAYDGVEFATSYLPSGTWLGGPFWFPGPFHLATSFWATIKGKL